MSERSCLFVLFWIDFFILDLHRYSYDQAQHNPNTCNHVK